MLFQKTFLHYCDKASPYCFLQLCEARHAKPIFPLWQTIQPRKINSILIKRNQTGQRNALTSKQQGDLLGARNQKVFTERKYSLAVILQTQWTDNFSEREFFCFYNMKYELTPFGMYFAKTQLHTNEKTSPSYRIRLL